MNTLSKNLTAILAFAFIAFIWLLPSEAWAAPPLIERATESIMWRALKWLLPWPPKGQDPAWHWEGVFCVVIPSEESESRDLGRLSVGGF